MGTEIRGGQVKDDTLTGADLSNDTGIWDINDVYSAADRVFWKGKIWDANATTTAGEEPSVSGKWDEVPVGGGKVLQVVSFTKTDVYSSTTTTPTVIGNGTNNLEVSITPASTSNKILLFAHINIIQNVADRTFFVRFARGGTAIAIGDAASNRTRTYLAPRYPDGPAADSMEPAGMSFLDSPASTSALTYSVQAWQSVLTGGTFVVNSSGNDLDQSNFGRGVSTITAMEIEG